MIRILICDDEPDVIKRTKNWIEHLGEKHSVDTSLKSFTSAEQLFFYIEDRAAFTDIVFLDISMPGMDGMTAANRLRAQGYNGEIIFLTNRAEKAIEGYDVQAFHFIVKHSVSKDEFERIFLRAVEQVESNTTEYITFQGVGESRNVPIRDIQYFSIYKRIVTVHYGSEEFDFYSTMEKIEATMMEYGFLRVQRSYLVNIDYIKAFASDRVTMQDGTEISISRKYSKEIRETITARGRK